MKFHNLASSSAGNLYLLESDDHRLLIECGLPWGHLQEALEFEVSGLDGCLLTHSHGDHSRSACRLMGAGVDLYASQETITAIQCRPDGVSAHHRAHVLRPIRHEAAAVAAQVPLRALAVGVGPWQVLPFPVVHDAEGSLGFLIGAPDGDQILFATDCAYIPVRAGGCTHIAIGCSWSEPLIAASTVAPEHLARLIGNHMSLERVLAMLKVADLSRLKEIHLLHISPAHGDPEGFAAAVRGLTGKPCYAKGAK